jgi:hypothetical protein
MGSQETEWKYLRRMLQKKSAGGARDVLPLAAAFGLGDGACGGG